MGKEQSEKLQVNEASVPVARKRHKPLMKTSHVPTSFFVGYVYVCFSTFCMPEEDTEVEGQYTTTTTTTIYCIKYFGILQMR
jgi:hypothetical protein